MDITLTWDFVLVAFFLIVVAYSYLVGKHQCVKVVVATYIALVAVQGLTTLIGRFGGEYQAALTALDFRVDDDILSVGKLLLFLVVMVLIAIEGGFTVNYEKNEWSPANVIASGALGLATGALILVTLTTYVAGLPLLSPGLAQSPALAPVLQQSYILWTIVSFQDIWYTLPAGLLLFFGFYEHW